MPVAKTSFLSIMRPGIQAVLGSFPLQPDKSIAVTTMGYGAIRFVAQHVGRLRQIEVAEIPMPFEVTAPNDLVDAFVAGLPQNAGLVVIDHICSDTGIVWPLADLIAAAQANGTRVLVDGRARARFDSPRRPLARRRLLRRQLA